MLRRHFYFEEDWQYVVSALWVFQAKAALLLPAVFYLFIGGAYGRGKTTLLFLLAKLTGGLLFENVSAAAMARSMADGIPVCIDEIDVSRGKEYDSVRDALLRQGYKRDCAPYVRWDVTTKQREEVEIYGPKAGTFRGTLEDALQSRGFVIPTAKPAGEDGYAYVLANMWPNLRDLPRRLDQWAESAREAFTPDYIHDTAHSAAFRDRVKRAVVELGANRESEIISIALLIAEMLGVSVEDELRRVSELSQTVTGESTAEDLAEIAEILLALAGPEQEKLADAVPDVPIIQVDIKSELNRRRADRGEPALRGHRYFAELRRELGIKDAWLRKWRNRLVWRIPVPFLDTLKEGYTNIPNIPNIESESDVSNVSNVSIGRLETEGPDDDGISLPTRLLHFLKGQRDPVAPAYITRQVSARSQDLVEKWLEKFRDEGKAIERDGLWKGV